MPLSPSDEVSFCRVDDQTFLLDLRSGRYSQLHQPAAIAFERLRLGRSLDGADLAALSPLVDAGLLETRDEAFRPAEICATTPIARSLLDTDGAPGDRRAVLVALMRFAAVSLRLRLAGLNPVLRGIARRKDALLARDHGPAADPKLVARAFLGLDALIGRRDRCLPRSIALASWLIASGAPADIVFGVTGRPFHAHCWVQLDDLLVSDRLEHVRDYTPILVI